MTSPRTTPTRALAWAGLLLAAVGASPGAQACSLAYPSDLESTWLGEDAAVANLGSAVARLPLDSAQPQPVVDLFFPGTPRFVVHPEGRYLVHDDQEGLGADCSGRRYAQALHLNGTVAHQWPQAMRPLVAVPAGFVTAPASLEDARLVAWDTWTATRLTGLPDVHPNEVSAAASRDGTTLAFATRQQVVLHVLGQATLEPVRLELPGGDVHAAALNADGSRVAVASLHYAGAGTPRGEHQVLRLMAGARGDEALTTLLEVRLPLDTWWRPSLVWHDGHWAIASPEGVHLVPEAGGDARLLPFPREEVRSLASSSAGTWFAAFTGNGTEAAAIHVYGPGWLELRTLRPQGSGWEVEAPRPSPPPTTMEGKGTPSPALGLLLAALLVLARRTR